MLLLSFLKTSTKGKKGLASTNVKLMNPIIKYNMKNLLNVCLYPRIVNSIANISLSSKELLHSVYFIPVWMRTIIENFFVLLYISHSNIYSNIVFKLELQDFD